MVALSSDEEVGSGCQSASEGETEYGRSGWDCGTAGCASILDYISNALEAEGDVGRSRLVLAARVWFPRSNSPQRKPSLGLSLEAYPVSRFAVGGTASQRAVSAQLLYQPAGSRDPLVTVLRISLQCANPASKKHHSIQQQP